MREVASVVFRFCISRVLFRGRVARIAVVVGLASALCSCSERSALQPSSVSPKKGTSTAAAPASRVRYVTVSGRKASAPPRPRHSRAVVPTFGIRGIAPADVQFQRKAETSYRRGEYAEALEYYLKLVRRRPNSGEGWFNVGAVSLAIGDHKQAVRALTDAIEYGYARKEAYHNLGLAYLALGKKRSAEKVWKLALRRGIHAPEIRSALGYLALEDQNNDRARRYFLEALEGDPNLVAAHNGLGVAALQKGQLPDAIRHWRAAENASKRGGDRVSGGFTFRSPVAGAGQDRVLGIAVAPDLTEITKRDEAFATLFEQGAYGEVLRLLRERRANEEERPSHWSLTGYALLQSGKLQGALEALRKAVALESGDPATYVNLALLEMRLGDLAGGERSLKQLDTVLTEQDLSRGEARLYRALSSAVRGDLALQRGNGDQALRAYRQALELQPDLVSVRNNAAVLQARRGKLSDALQTLQETESLLVKDQRREGEERSLVKKNLALVLLLAGRNESSERHLLELQQLRPRDADIPLHLGYIAGTSGKLQKAEALFRRAEALNPRSAVAVNNLGVLAEKRDQFEKAEQLYQRALSLDNNLAEALNNLGSTSLKQGKRTEALEAYKKAVSLSAVDYESRRNIGHLLLLDGEPEEAATHLQLALAIQPRDLDTIFDLALAYQQMGKATETITFLETFLEFVGNDGSRSEQAVRAERMLQKLRYG
ncbi:tetratricopeptide repeat protein [bacterium]|nr:tetratricopeptide repeat protein [bacterium]